MDQEDEEELASCLNAVTHLEELTAKIKSLSFVTLSRHFAALERLTLPCTYSDCARAETILEFCPNLIPLSGKSLRRTEKGPWVCLRLETFSAMIVVDPYESLKEAEVSSGRAISLSVWGNSHA